MRRRSLILTWIAESYGIEAAIFFAMIVIALCCAFLLCYEIYYYEYRKRGIYQRIMKERAQPPITKEEAKYLRKKQRQKSKEQREERR